jgi:hypothetical protein
VRVAATARARDPQALALAARELERQQPPLSSGPWLARRVITPPQSVAMARRVNRLG